MSIRASVRSTVGTAFKNETLSGGSSSSGSPTPLRFASAQNFSATGAGTRDLGTGNARTDSYSSAFHTIGQDMTVMVLGLTMQWLKAATGVSNVGNSITIDELAVEYNGHWVAVTSGGQQSFTIADTANWFSDPIASTSLSAAKFTKGTNCNVRVHWHTTSPTTDKFPSGRIRSSVDSYISLDPTHQTIINGVYSTGAITYTDFKVTATSATAVGTLVTLTVPSTAALVNGKPYTIAGATGTGNQLNYNGRFVITVVDGTTVQYTASSAPSASATGTVTCGGANGTDAQSGNFMLPIYVLGYHTAPAVGFWGDSKTQGTGDTVTSIGVQGMSRALFVTPTSAATVQCAGLNMGCPSGVALECYTATASGVVANWEAWYSYLNYAVVGYGTNGQVTANQSSLWARIRAKGIGPITQRSFTPRTQTLNSSPVSITSLTTDTVTTTVTGTMADTSGLINGQTYPISGASPAVYNGSFAITVVNGTTFTYTAGSIPASNATGTLVLNDQFRTVQYQTINSSWGIGSVSDTFEQFLRAAVSTDSQMTYFQSTGERNGATVGTTAYWQWGVNGTANYMTADGLHETAVGYEQNIGTGGTITTQAGGTVARTLRAHIGSFT